MLLFRIIWITFITSTTLLETVTGRVNPKKPEMERYIELAKGQGVTGVEAVHSVYYECLPGPVYPQ